MAQSKKKTDAGKADGLGARLKAEKLITAKQLERAEAHLEESDRTLIGVLAEMGLVTEGMLPILEEEEGLRTIELSSAEPDPAATATIDEKMARKHIVVPVGFDGDRLLLAMSDPEDTAAIEDVAAFSGLMVEPALASRTAVLEAIDGVYGTPSDGAAEAPTASDETPDADELGDLEEEFASTGREVRRVGKRLGMGEEAQAVDLHELLEQVITREASDLHLTVGVPPVIRLHGDLTPMDEYPVLEGDDLQKLVYGMLTQKQRERLESELELDFSYSLPGKGRFRVNVYLQRNTYGAAFRLIPYEIKAIEELGLPARMAEFSKLPRGLILVTGPTGSGKSTTLASLVDIVNRERAVHIMTVEDPIEFLHSHKKAVVNQREVGSDTLGFAPALKHVLRQDPDVILVGELRDLETIQMAITAAETGHLVFGTLHTQDAPQTIDRIIDVFPAHQQQQIRVQLAASLQGVVAQQLLQTPDGKGRVAAAELLVATPAVRNLIREAKTHQIYSSIQSGGKDGMQTMDSALAELVRLGKITFEEAKEHCHSLDEVSRLVGSERVGQSGGGPKARVIG